MFNTIIMCMVIVIFYFTDLIRTIAAGRRRSSTYSDNESLAGCYTRVIKK